MAPSSYMYTLGSITYPNHSSFMGRALVTEQYRRKGHGQKFLTTSFESLDNTIIPLEMMQ